MILLLDTLKTVGLDLIAFITEIGLSSVHPSGGANIVDANPNSDYQQDSVDLFFKSHSVSFLESLDQNPLWQFVDEKTDDWHLGCLLYTSPSPRDVEESRMPSSA